MLLARAGEGSMRDSLSAFDQVRAFAGDTIVIDDVVTVLGLVGRDLVFDMLEAVAAEDAPSAFALVERAIERGYDLRLLCRELARATRDLLILSVDPKRAPPIPTSPPTPSASGWCAMARPMVARRPAARVRFADEGGAGSPGLGSAALQPRDGAPAPDASAQAGAAERPPGRRQDAARSSRADGPCRAACLTGVRTAVVPPAVRMPAARPSSPHRRAGSPAATTRRPARRPMPPAPPRRRRRRPTCLQGSLPGRSEVRASRRSTTSWWRRRSASTRSPSGVTFTFLPNQKNAEEPVRRAEGVAAVDRREGRRQKPCRSRSPLPTPAPPPRRRAAAAAGIRRHGATSRRSSIDA